MAKIVYLTAFLWSIVQVIGVLVFKENIILFYTIDKPIINAVSPAWNILALFVFFDCMQAVSSGNVNGLGIIKEVRWASTINYWVIGLPISCYLMFSKNLFLYGLWWGPTVAVLLNFLTFEYKVQTADWQEICDKHAEKMKLKSLENKKDLSEEETNKVEDNEKKPANSIQEGGEKEDRYAKHV